MNRQKARKTILAVMLLLFPVMFYYFSPYLIIQAGAEGIIASSAITFAALFISSLFLGRAFCGWLCPAGATQEMLTKVRQKPFADGKKNLIKYAIWAPWIAIIVLMFLRAGGVKAIDPLYETYYGISVSDMQSAIMFLIVFALIAGVAAALGKRGSCHTICWMAPFMVIGRKIRDAANIPALQLEVDSNKCINCGACTRNCSMSLNVKGMVQKQSMENAECILCGRCVDVCPKGAIKYSFNKITHTKSQRQ